MKSVKEQQRIADDLLGKLHMADPSAIIAGGAPRDWYLGRPAQDLDVYLYLREDLSLSWLERQLETLLPDVTLKALGSEKFKEHYETNPNIRCVFDFMYKGQQCQIILMKKPTFIGVVESFPFSVCEAYYTGGQIFTTKAFTWSLRHGCVVQKNQHLYADGNRYIEKIKDRFPHYKFFESWEQAALYVIETGE